MQPDEIKKLHIENENKRLLNSFLKAIAIENEFERLKQIIYLCTINDVVIVTYKNEYGFININIDETISNFSRYLLKKMDLK